MTTRAFDLSALEEALQGDAKYRPLRGQVRRHLALLSASRDLQHAYGALELLVKLEPAEAGYGPASPELGMQQRALFTQALLLYAGVTKTSSKSRAPFEVRRHYPPWAQAAHDELCKLRDDAIAHFGQGGNPSSPWVQERLALTITKEGQARIQHVWKGTNYRAQQVEDLSKLISEATQLARAKASETGRELTEAIAALIAADVGFRQAISRSPFDPLTYFKSEEHAAEFWSADSSGGLPATRFAPRDDLA